VHRKTLFAVPLQNVYQECRLGIVVVFVVIIIIVVVVVQNQECHLGFIITIIG
jgi:hypothetical protein